MRNIANEVHRRWGGTDACREHEQKTKNCTKDKWAEATEGLRVISAEFAVDTIEVCRKK